MTPTAGSEAPVSCEADASHGASCSSGRGIEIRGLTKGYDVDGRCVAVLRGVDLSVREGAITVILGRSGCGKTTLLRLVGGLEEPDGGSISFSVAHKTAFVFQEPRLMPWLTVRDNVAFGLSRSRHDSAVVTDAIATVGLAEFEGALPRQLSGGMQQRAALARALAYGPSFILMDEPFAALDHFTREQMQKELLRVRNRTGASIMFVTHSVDEALLLGDEIVVIRDGLVSLRLAPEAPTGGRDLLGEELIGLKRQILAAIDRPSRESGADAEDAVITPPLPVR